MNRYCGCIDTDCSVCYEIEAPYCFDFVALPYAIQYAALWIWVRDKFGNLYYERLNSIGGTYYLVASDFTKEIFSAENGAVTIFVSTDAAGTALVSFIAGYYIYTCITLTTLPPIYLTDECGNFITDEDDNYIIIS